MQLTKKVIALSTSALLVFGLLAVPVAAVHADDSVNQDNNSTGNNSVNKNKTKIKRVNKVTKKKIANVTNAVAVSANTGGNKSKHNTNGGSVDSGNIDATVDLTNNLNQSGQEGCCCDGVDPVAVDADQTNQDTGNNSTNVNKVKVKDKNVCKDISRANVTNSVALSGNTGGNKAVGNTNSGDVDSGDVTFTVNISNTAN